MNCRNVRRAMLEVERCELDDTDQGALAAHIGECSDCRARATIIIAGTDALRVAVLSTTPRVAAPLVPRRNRRPILVGAAAVAASVLAMVALGTHPSSKRSNVDMGPAPIGGVRIDDSQGREVAVLQSADSAFTAIVFWNGGAQ